MLGEIAKLPNVTTVVSPYTPEGAAHVSKDQTVVFASVTFDKLAQNIPTSQAKTFVSTAESASGGNLHVAVAGQLAEQANRPAIGGTGLGILLAGIVLLLVFGSVFAMALPLVSALASLGTAIGLIGILSNVLKMPEFSTELVLLIGLGVGVDYALFIVTRHRQGLVAGNDVETSIVNSVNTSGRAVLFAGIIVCIALLGMFALQVTFLYGLAIAASIGVLLTMIAALDPAPGTARLHRPEGAQPTAEAAPGRERPDGGRGGDDRLLAALVGRRAAPPGRAGARRPRRHRAVGDPVLLAPPRLVRPGQRPGRHDDADRLRPALQGLRAWLQRPVAAGHRRPRHDRRRPSSTT